LAGERPLAAGAKENNAMILKFMCALAAATAVCLPANAWANSDEQAWATGSATVKVSDRWRISQEMVVRTSDAKNGIYEVESNTMLGYRLNDHVTIAAGYTHDPQYAGGQFTAMEHRAREQVTFGNLAQIGPAKLTARIRIEQRWREGIDGTGWRLRPYAKVSLPVSGKVALNLSSEPFFNLNHTAFQHSTGLDKMRNLLSLSAPLSKTLSGEVGYMNQHGFVRGGPDTSDNVAYFAIALNL
jgi:hypothetical protein